jgi:hypothetical protein
VAAETTPPVKLASVEPIVPQPAAPAEPELTLTAELEAPPPPPSGVDSIGAIVRRIEAFRRARVAAPVSDAPQLPLDGDVTPFNPIRAFDFTSDTEGRITWAEGGMAPMVVGHLLAHHPALALAVRQHQPFRAISVALEGAQGVTGEWQVDAVPRFDPLSGRFVGHIGRMRRPRSARSTRPRPPPMATGCVRCFMNCARRSTPSRALPRSSSSSFSAPRRMNIALWPPSSPPTARACWPASRSWSASPASTAARWNWPAAPATWPNA